MLQTACRTHGFSRDAQLQATVNKSMKNLYFTCCDGNHQWPDHGRTLARTPCYGEEPNAMVRQLNFCCISIKSFVSKFRASNTSLNRAEYALTRKEHFSTTTLIYPNPPSPAKRRALLLRGPNQTPCCLSLSYSTSLWFEYEAWDYALQ
jgi:hypothetical protein